MMGHNDVFTVSLGQILKSNMVQVIILEEVETIAPPMILITTHICQITPCVLTEQEGTVGIVRISRRVTTTLHWIVITVLTIGCSVLVLSTTLHVIAITVLTIKCSMLVPL